MACGACMGFFSLFFAPLEGFSDESLVVLFEASQTRAEVSVCLDVRGHAVVAVAQESLDAQDLEQVVESGVSGEPRLLLRGFDEREEGELVLCQAVTGGDRQQPAEVFCDVRVDLVEGLQLYFQALGE